MKFIFFTAFYICITTNYAFTELVCDKPNEHKDCEPCEGFICGFSCTEVCLCDPDYKRQEDGTCVLAEEESTELTCDKPNEYIGCEPCDTIICPLDCTETCLCEPGFERGSDGDCVSKNEESTDLVCDKSNEHKGCAPCDGICFDDCRETCLCDEGYERGEDGVCAPKSEENITCTGSHEKLDCEPCTDDQECRPVCNSVCLCEEGYERDEDNICVETTDVPIELVCDKPYEHKGCEPCDSLICPLDCTETCLCDEGYERGEDGICVSKAEDAEELVCYGSHEIKGCEPCQSEICTESCNQICECEQGYIRGESGICEPENKEVEELVCDGPHEIKGCEPCQSEVCTASCNQICECEQGYIRGGNGICEPENKVLDDYTKLVCKGDHETIGCEPCTTDVCPYSCTETCVCEQGFVKGNNDMCEPIVKASLTGCHRPHEVKICEPCKGTVCSSDCKDICVCEEGYIRKRGICKSILDVGRYCPGPNEVSRCKPCTTDRCPYICDQECICIEGHTREENGLCTANNELY